MSKNPEIAIDWSSCNRDKTSAAMIESRNDKLKRDADFGATETSKVVLFFSLKGLPDSFSNSSSISSLFLDLGILPTKRRVFGSLTFTLRSFPSPIS